MKHKWALSWPGNFCTRCGFEDPWEDAIMCPDCKFDWSGIDNPDPDYRPQPPQLCEKHKKLAESECEDFLGETLGDPEE